MLTVEHAVEGVEALKQSLKNFVAPLNKEVKAKKLKADAQACFKRVEYELKKRKCKKTPINLTDLIPTEAKPKYAGRVDFESSIKLQIL